VLASGPGCVFFGISTPIWKPATSESNFQPRFHPFAVAVLLDAENRIFWEIEIPKIGIDLHV